MFGSSVFGRTPYGAVKFNPFYIVATIGRNTQFGSSKVVLKMRAKPVVRATFYGTPGTRRVFRVKTIMPRTGFGIVVVYAWHDASNGYLRVNRWSANGRIYEV